MTPRSPWHFAAAIVATAFFGQPASAGELTGPAQVVDGGNIVIAGQRIRLHGLDAPPLDRICLQGTKNWRCGEEAAFALAAIVERHWVTCQTGQHQAAATCRMGGPKGIDIGQALVQEGWAKALAGSGYEQAQQAAKRAGRGLWAPR